MAQKIISCTNEKIKLVKKLSLSSKTRKKNKMFVIEGLRLCYDAVNSNIKIKYIFYTTQAMKKYKEKLEIIIKNSEESYLVDETVEKHISDTLNPQGIFCVAYMKKDFNFDLNKESKIIALENIQDPLNLGTILRSAEAFGIHGILMSHDCVDVYNPKVLRGGMGSIFRLRISFAKDIADEIEKVSHLGFKTYATLPDRSCTKITDINFWGKCLAVIGNEGNGISKRTIELCDEKITIPMKGMAESLNAAAAASVVMWEMMR